MHEHTNDWEAKTRQVAVAAPAHLPRVWEAVYACSAMTDRALWHPWIRVTRLVRSILEVRRDEVTRPVLKVTLTKALREREKIRRAGWFS